MSHRMDSLPAENVEEIGGLDSGDTGELWDLFVAIHRTWGDDRTCRPEDLASRWREFIRVKCDEAPSYLETYRDAADLLRQLKETFGNELYQNLFFRNDIQPEHRFLNLKKNVIDEFIRVYVNSGGFRSFGARNYGGFVSGSRFRSQRPYRTYEVD